MLKMALAPPGDCKKKTRGKALQTKFIVNWIEVSKGSEATFAGRW